jgi:hypothetical protein
LQIAHPQNPRCLVLKYFLQILRKRKAFMAMKANNVFLAGISRTGRSKRGSVGEVESISVLTGIKKRLREKDGMEYPFMRFVFKSFPEISRSWLTCKYDLDTIHIILLHGIHRPALCTAEELSGIHFRNHIARLATNAKLFVADFLLVFRPCSNA